MAHEDWVANLEGDRPRVMDRGLHFTRALVCIELCSLRQVGVWLLFGANRYGGDIAAAKTGVDVRLRAAHNLNGIARGGLIAKVTVVIEESRRKEGRANSDLRHNVFQAGRVDSMLPVPPPLTKRNAIS